MAIVKHIPVKNSNYYQAYEYLKYQFDERTMHPILDDEGYKIPRQEYLLDCINCLCPESFPVECNELNYATNKNQTKSEIKMHHYIISFDPKDKDNLSLEKTMELGKEIAKKFFYGHQVLLAAHPDGHNGSENMHVHIVINSVRKYDVPKEVWMDGTRDHKAGCKHRYSNNFQKELKKYVMEMCNREGLHQVDLLSPAAEKITDKEYRQMQSWEEKQKQEEREKQNENVNPKREAAAAAFAPEQETKENANHVSSSKSKSASREPEKAKLRKSIRAAIAQSKNEEEFRRVLWEKYKVELHVSRGRWGYRSVGNTRPTRGRMLGRNYEREYILKELSAVRAVSDVSKVQTAGLKNKIKIENNNRKLQTLNFLMANGCKSIEELHDKLNTSLQAINDSKILYIRKKQDLKTINSLIHYEGQYFANRKIYMEYINLPKSKQEKFFLAHQDELVKFSDANRQIKKEMDMAGLKSMPRLDNLKEQKRVLGEVMEKLEDQIADEEQRYEELRNVEHNAMVMMNIENSRISTETSKRKSNLAL